MLTRPKLSPIDVVTRVCTKSYTYTLHLLLECSFLRCGGVRFLFRLGTPPPLGEGVIRVGGLEFGGLGLGFGLGLGLVGQGLTVDGRA